MKFFQGTTDFYLDGACAVTLGKFDGVHLGHQKLMRRIRELETDTVSSVVFALKTRTEELLLTGEEQKDIVKNMGISCLIECPFVPEIAGMQPEEFVEKILVERLHAKHIVVGTDFRFGCRRKGDARLLSAMQDKYGFQVDILEKEKLGDREISSTYVREALAQGRMELVTQLLGRPFSIKGVVQHGRRIGRTLGMPTLNLVPSLQKLLPPNGVYASRTLVGGTYYPGVTNIGYKPTVGERFRGVETYLFDVDLELYGQEIVTELFCFERPEQKFPSLEELKAQMHRDISFGRAYFRE